MGNSQKCKPGASCCMGTYDRKDKKDYGNVRCCCDNYINKIKNNVDIWSNGPSVDISPKTYEERFFGFARK